MKKVPRYSSTAGLFNQLKKKYYKPCFVYMCIRQHFILLSFARRFGRIVLPWIIAFMSVTFCLCQKKNAPELPGAFLYKVRI